MLVKTKAFVPLLLHSQALELQQYHIIYGSVIILSTRVPVDLQPHFMTKVKCGFEGGWYDILATERVRHTSHNSSQGVHCRDTYSFEKRLGIRKTSSFTPRPGPEAVGYWIGLVLYSRRE